MRTYPIDEYDQKELARLGAPVWMVEQLKLNPSYVFWGVHEDYMSKSGQGWDSRVIVESWSEFPGWSLDDLNEVVNFYFAIDRDAKTCEACDGTGHNRLTKIIADNFYDHNSPTREARWCDKITNDEVEALIAHNRLWGFWRTFEPGKGWTDTGKPEVTDELVAKVNAANRPGAGMLDGHDAINRGILIETRARRLGVWGCCEQCQGHGEVFTSPTARLSLTLWVLHPRKGCSRGVEVQSVSEDDLPAVYAYLREAAQRNADRFSRIPSGEAVPKGA